MVRELLPGQPRHGGLGIAVRWDGVREVPGSNPVGEWLKIEDFSYRNIWGVFGRMWVRVIEHICLEGGAYRNNNGQMAQMA